MTRLLVSTLVFLVAVIGAAGCGGSSPTAGSEHVRYHEPSQGWTANVPAGWTSVVARARVRARRAAGRPDATAPARRTATARPPRRCASSRPARASPRRRGRASASANGCAGSGTGAARPASRGSRSISPWRRTARTRRSRCSSPAAPSADASSRRRCCRRSTASSRARPTGRAACSRPRRAIRRTGRRPAGAPRPRRRRGWTARGSTRCSPRSGAAKLPIDSVTVIRHGHVVLDAALGQLRLGQPRRAVRVRTPARAAVRDEVGHLDAARHRPARAGCDRRHRDDARAAPRRRRPLRPRAHRRAQAGHDARGHADDAVRARVEGVGLRLRARQRQRRDGDARDEGLDEVRDRPPDGRAAGHDLRLQHRHVAPRLGGGHAC